MPPPNRKPKTGVGFGLVAILLAVPMVAFFEGTVLHTYTDPVGIPTACMGETDKEVTVRNRFTEQECSALLGASMMAHAMALSPCIEVPVKANEAAALVSWSFNIGTTAACNSTLVKKLNAGTPPVIWCAELHKWIYAKGRPFNGLIKRRKAEYKMCMTGAWK